MKWLFHFSILIPDSNTSHVKVYRFDAHASSIPSAYSNTSHVKVYRGIEPDVELDEEIQIHLMLKFIVVGNVSKYTINHSNTSHVKVYQAEEKPG